MIRRTLGLVQIHTDLCGLMLPCKVKVGHNEGHLLEEDRGDSRAQEAGSGEAR